MTNKEFYVKMLKDEQGRFRNIIEALPDDKHEYKVHEKSRTAGNITAQIAVQWKAVSGIVTKGAPDFNPHDMENQSKSDMVAKFEEGMTQLYKDLETVSEEVWETGEASMGEMWKSTKGEMAWGFLFDAIHHRGQLTTYLRAMGAVVPSIYGPTADSKS